MFSLLPTQGGRRCVRRLPGLLALVLLSAARAWAQPAYVGTNVATVSNGNYGTFNAAALTDKGTFRQYQVQAANSTNDNVAEWQFVAASNNNPDYNNKWMPNASYKVRIVGFNQVIYPDDSTSPSYGTAYYVGNGGTPGGLPALTAGNWYTYNVTKNAPSSSNTMSVLETTAKPATISSVAPAGSSNTTAYGNPYTVTATLGAAPSSSEKFWIRYTTDGYNTSSLAAMTVSGSTATGSIPSQVTGGGSPTVQYYVLSSPAASSLAVGSVNGTVADILTLNLTAGGSFTYTQATFTSVTQSPAAGSVPYNGNVTVTATLSAAPGAGEYVYLRYATNSNFNPSSTIPMTVSGTTATATLAGQASTAAPNPTVYYYALTSYSSSAAGNTNPDGTTLQRGNNSGNNYTYTYQHTGITGTTRSPAGTVYYGDAVTVTSTLSAAPYSTEYFYVRYTTDNYATSTIVAMTVSGSSAAASIPGQVTGKTVSYYVFSSPSSTLAGSYTGNAGAFATLAIDNSNGNNYTYTVDKLLGTYTVNPSGTGTRNFVTMGSAFGALSNSGVAGAVTVSVRDGVTFNESNLNLISPPGTSATNTITIQRDMSGAARPLVQPPSTAAPGKQDALIKLQGADYVTIDGIDVGEYPSITAANLAAGNNPAMEYGYAFFRNSATDGCQYNTIRNSNITLNSTNGNPTYGVYLASTDISGTAVTASSAAGANSYNNVLGCATTSTQNGMTAAGSTGSYPDQSNVLGNVQGTVLGNTVSNTTSFGILAYNQTNATIGSNVISFPTGNTGNQYGIVVGGNTPGMLVARNRVYSIKYAGTAGKGVRGISLDPGSGTFNITVRNNSVSNLTADGNGASTDSQIMGIGVLSGTGFSIYNNSVQLNGDRANNAYSNKIAAALYVAGGVSSIDLRNNVLSNLQTSSDTDAGQTGTNYGVYADGTGSPFTTIDYNLYDLRSGAALRTEANSPQYLGHLSGSDYNTLAGWQAVTGQARSSQFSDGSGPNTLAFTSATDLTPDPSSPSVWVLNGMGVQIASVTADLVGSNRPTTVAAGAPDLGAYEVNPTSTPNPLVVSAAPAAGGTQVFSLNGRTIATLVWGTAGTVPAAVTGRYYSGTNPPTPYTSGNNTQNDYFTFADATGNGSGYSYTLQTFYDPASLGTIGSETTQQLQQRNADNGGYTALPTNDNTTNRTLSATPSLTRLGTFAAFESSTPLPVTLVSFAARRQGQDALLTWATASELHNSGFEVQVSTDGRNFRALGFVAATGGDGSRAQAYRYLDQEAGKAGLRYYRLRQLDFDGTATFTVVRTVQFDERTTAAFSAYPSPFRGSDLTVELTLPQAVDAATLTLTDAVGREVLRQPLGALPAGLSQPALPALGSLPAGLYVLRLALPAGVQTVKVVKE